MRKFLLVLAILGLAVPVAAYADGLQVPPPLGVTLGSTSIPNGGTATTVTGLSIVAGGSNTLGAISLNLNGATLGTDTLGVNGTASLGNLNVTSSTIPVNGMYLSAANQIGFATNSTLRYTLSLTTGFNSNISGGARLGPGAGSSTICTLIPNNTAPTTCFTGDGTNLYGVFSGVVGVTWAPTRETLAAGFTFGSALTASNPGTAGFSGIQTPSTLTDSGSTGTTAALYGNVFGGNTIVATNTKTYTLEASTYFRADVAGTGTTFTANYALGADSMVIGISSPMVVTPSGNVGINGTLTASNSNFVSNSLSISTAGARAWNAGAYAWSSSSSSAGTTDTTLCRQASGVVEVGASASCASSGSLLLATITFTGTAPTITGTGTPSCASTGSGCTNSAGDVTAGASATSVVVTFSGSGFGTGVPSCLVQAHTQLVAFSYVVTNTAITITQTATSGDVITYHCDPH